MHRQKTIKCLVVEEQPATNYIQTVYLNGVKEKKNCIASNHSPRLLKSPVKRNGPDHSTSNPHVRFSHVKGKYPRSTQGSELSFHSLLQFLLAEHERIRVQGVCEGVVRDQI